jgi:hypothetical protein
LRRIHRQGGLIMGAPGNVQVRFRGHAFVCGRTRNCGAGQVFAIFAMTILT